jgi:two-component system LytT family response regulator
MIKILIIDDEQKARNVLHHLIIDLVPEVTEVRAAASAREAREILRFYQPDIVFLDIEMPYQNGFDMLVAIKDFNFDVIFTTAYHKYAIQALRFSALDFLLKPIDPVELTEAVKRHIANRGSSKQKRQLFENFVNNADKHELKDYRLAVPSSEGVYFFPIPQVLRLEADRNYTIIHLTDGKRFVASKTLKYFEDLLERFKFIRTHKSHLVNSQHIIRLCNGNEYITLCDGTQIEISRRKRDAVLRLMHVR